MARRPKTNPFAVTPATMFEQALARHREGRLAEAKTFYETVLAGDPRHFDSLHMLGVIALQSGDPQRAYDLIIAALAIKPDFPAAHGNLAAVLRALGRLDEALLAYNQAIRLQPDRIPAHQDRGDVLLALGRPAEAVASFDEVLALQPDHLDARLGRTIALDRVDKVGKGITGAAAVDALRQDYAAAFYNHGNGMAAAKRLGDALASYDRALALAPHFAEAHNNRANILYDLRRLEEAAAGFERALAAKPNWAEPHNNRANALWGLGRVAEALSGYERAIILREDYPEAHNNRGNVLLAIKRPAHALASFDRALALRPDFDFLAGAALNAKLKASDWTGLSERIAAVRDGVVLGKRMIAPFIAALAIDDPDVQSRSSRIFADALYPSAPAIAGQPSARSRKIRVGYYSADFHEHATAWLIAGLLEHHDSAGFEVFLFSFGPNRHDPMRRRIAEGPGRFIDVRHRDDQAIALLSRKLGIDIAVDLKGYTEGARPGIFAARCAPLQVNYLGFPGTMGADHYDYVIADRTVLPQEHWQYYSERVAYLPDSYQPNDAKRPISNRNFTRAELGLPETGFVFCCFNAAPKLTPALFDRWVRILAAVEGSVLWLYQDNLDAVDNLRREAEARGLDPERLIFAPHMAQDEHLARHRVADLFLDGWPYGAHTTASDALWAGLPVLTCPGRSFPSRVAASLLTAAGLPELIAAGEDDYERRAIELATDMAQLAEIRAKLDANRSTCPLFDTARYASNIEAIYSAMQSRHRAGMWPAPLVLPPPR